MNTTRKIAATTMSVAILFGLSGLTSVALAAGPVPAHSAAAAVDSRHLAARIADTAGFPAALSVQPDSAAIQGAPAAAVKDQRAAQNVQYQTFTITNLSGQPMTLTDFYSWENAHNELPPVGTVIAPGTQLSFKVSWEFGWINNATLNFSTPSNAVQVVAGVRAKDFPIWESRGQTSSWVAYPDALTTVNSDNGVVIYDAGSPVIDVPASQAQQQADLLNQFCQNGNATCTFTPKGQIETVGERHPVGTIAEIRNGTLDDMQRVVTIEEAVSASDSVGVSASVEATLLDIVTMSLGATYEHGWTTSHTFTDQQTVTIRPHHIGWVESVLPILRTTGDFTVKLGNTTWVLHGVTFDSPDTSRPAIFEFKDRDMTDAQKAQFAGEVSVPDVIAGMTAANAG
jgi:hypothetical protein